MHASLQLECKRLCLLVSITFHLLTHTMHIRAHGKLLYNVSAYSMHFCICCCWARADHGYFHGERKRFTGLFKLPNNRSKYLQKLTLYRKLLSIKVLRLIFIKIMYALSGYELRLRTASQQMFSVQLQHTQLKMQNICRIGCCWHSANFCVWIKCFSFFIIVYDTNCVDWLKQKSFILNASKFERNAYIHFVGNAK